MIKRLLVSVATATMMFAGVLPGALSIPSASADEWCDTDPPATIITPAGNTFTFNITEGVLGVQHQPTLSQTLVTAGASRVKGTQKTLVKVLVYIPNDSYGTFQTRSNAHNAAGTTTYASTTGNSGTYMSMQFTIDLP